MCVHVTRLLMLLSLEWLYYVYCTIGKPQPILYLKSIFLEILNVTTWLVFQNQVTYSNSKVKSLAYCSQKISLLQIQNALPKVF